MHSTSVFQEVLGDLLVSKSVINHPETLAASANVDFGIKCYQWKGTNFIDIQEALSHQLSGYVYRKDDDLIIDFNDGYSIKKVAPLDWILIIQEDNDISVMSDKMFNILRDCLQDTLDLSSSDTNERDSVSKEVLDDQSVDLNVETKYGDKVELMSDKDGKMHLKFCSYQGDYVTVDHTGKPFSSDSCTKIYLNDRYGNRMTVNGGGLTSNKQSIRTSSDLYERVSLLSDKALSKVKDVFDILGKCIENSKKIAT